MTLDEYMASIGVDMLHPGGMRRTIELAETLGVSGSARGMDVGCGFGKSICFLAGKFGCEMVGIDISKKMIRRAIRKSAKKKIKNKVNVLLGSAENIPLRDEVFDFVISEGTTVLVDKEESLKEYVRVTVHGGYVGLNELSWRKRPPEDLLEKTYNDLQGVHPLQHENWVKLLVDSGLSDVDSKPFMYSSISLDVLISLGIKSLAKVAFRYLTDSKIRDWTNRQETLFRRYSEYWAYGLYIGKRQ